jgi:hypothetical protein
MKIVVKFPIENNYIGKINNIAVFYPNLAMLKAIKNKFGTCGQEHDRVKNFSHIVRKFK